MAPKAS